MSNKKEPPSDLNLTNFSPELQGFVDSFSDSDLEKIYEKRRKKGIQGIIKDIEIRKSEFFLLLLILTSFASILFLILFTSVVLLATELELTLNYLSATLLGGLLFGAIFSGLMLDKIKKRLKLVRNAIFVTTLSLFIQISLLLSPVGLFNIIFYIINSFFVTVLFFIFLIFFLEYTSVMERGRVLSYLLMVSIVYVLIVAFIIGIALLFFPFVIYLPLLVNITTILYIQREKNLEKPPIAQLPSEKKHINTTLVKDIFFILFFGFSIGLVIPLEEFEILINMIFAAESIPYEVIYLFVLIILFCGITAFIIGYIFDFIGRLATITAIIVFIAGSSFLHLIETPLVYVNPIIIFSIIIADFMTVLLLVGDITRRKNYGKSLIIVFFVSVFGTVVGLTFNALILTTIIFSENANTILLALQYLSSVICLSILVNSKEALPHKEKEWFEALNHLYIIHKSGILIYDYNFSVVKNEVESDLISGGIIGLLSVLKEIVQGKEKLRVIDHGDNKLLFKFSPKRDVIFVLVIKEDLLVLRDKLDQFALEFVLTFKEKIDKLNDSVGLKVNDWLPTSKLVEKYFTRKYFELLRTRP